MSKGHFQTSGLYDLNPPVKKTLAAFTGDTTANSRGDYDGTGASQTLFTVTGDVMVYVLAVCTTDLAGSGKVEVGVTGNLGGIIAETTATDVDANDIWKAAAPTDVGVISTASAPVGPFTIVNGLDILETTTTANITSGQIYYTCIWRPLSPDGSVVAA